MSTRYQGIGTLQLNRGVDLPRSTMTLIADAHHEGGKREIRLTLKDFLPGGCAMQIVVSAEAAADLASELQALARSVADRLDPNQHTLRLAMTA